MAHAEETPVTIPQLMSFFQKMMEANRAESQEMIRTIVSEIRKPPVDPVKEAQRAREKLTKEAAEKEYWAKKERLKKNCSHTRQNGTSNIAWATQSDNIERGVCPYCSSTFTPDDGELYQQLRRLPRGMLESVRYVTA
jgi:hypothetical protein